MKFYLKRLFSVISIIFGVSTLTGAAFFKSCSSANYQKWQEGSPVNVTYFIDENSFDILNKNGTKQELLNEIHAGVTAWDSQTDASLVFTYGGNYQGPGGFPQGFVGCTSSDSGAFLLPKGLAIWADDVSAPHQSIDGNSVAGTTIAYACRDKIYGAQVQMMKDNKLSGVINWHSISDTTVSLLRLDLRSIVTHEVGHGLGLDHATTKDGSLVGSEGLDPPCEDSSGDVTEAATATMCKTGYLGYAVQRTLHSDDIAGIRFLYPPLSPTLESPPIRESESIANFSDPENENHWRMSPATVVTSSAQKPVLVQFHYRQFIIPFGPETGYKEVQYMERFFTDGREGDTLRTWFTSGQKVEIGTFLCKRCFIGIDVLGYRVKKDSTQIFRDVRATLGIAVTETKATATY